MENQSKKAALYIRVSTDSQYEEGYSVDAQKEKLEQYCHLKDITNYEFYIDGGWSGSNIDRPSMKKMIEEIRQEKISAVIVYKLDRLSRSQKDTVFLLEDVFIPNHCNFVSLNENFDTTTPYGKAMIGILSVFAQLERENIRERTRMGMYERIKLGLWMGGGRVPFGYDYDSNKNTLVPNEHAEEVRQIFQLYLQGYSAYELSKMFPSVANDSHVRSILSRITYCGKIDYNGEIFEGIHEAIISEETFEKVQVHLQRRSNKHIIKSEYLLSGFVFCGKCGAKMRYQKWGKRTVLYCYSQQSSKLYLVKDPNCDNKKMDAAHLEDIFLKSFFQRAKQIQKIKNLSSDTADSVFAVDILQSKFNTISQKIKRLYNLYAENEDSLLLETIEENKKDLEAISAQIEKEKESKHISNVLIEIQQALSSLEERWERMTTKEKRRAISLCLERIIITDDEIDISYKF